MPLSIIRMVWNHKLAVLACWILLTGAGAYLVRQLPNVYRAEAVVLVDSQKIPEKFVASTVQVSLEDSLNSISQQVLNVSRMQSIIDDFRLYPKDRKNKSPEELVDRIRKDLTITPERGFGGNNTANRAGAFRIAYDGPSPAVVAGVVNRVTDLFIHENLRAREQRAQGTSEFIESQLQEAKKSLEEQEANLSQYKLQWAGELPQQEGALMGALNRLQAELQGNQDAVNRAQQNKVMLENTLRFAEGSLASATRSFSQPAPSFTLPPTVRDANPEVAYVPGARRSDVLRAQLKALRLRYFDDHPEVKRVQTELTRVLAEESPAEVEQRKPSNRQTAESAPKAFSAPEANAPELTVSPQASAELSRERERVFSTRTQLQLVNNEIVALNKERERILSSIAQYQARVEKLPIREQQMAGLTRDYENSKFNYRSLLDKKMSAEMAAEMEHSQQSERFTVADPAHLPSKPIKPNRLMYYAAAALGSLLFSVAVALAFELKKNALLGEWELPPNVRVMGHVPRIASSPTATSPINFRSVRNGTAARELGRGVR
jgi:polysaccharide biosynthesis transport protein